MTATVKANSDGSADLLVNAIAAIHMAADGGVSFPQQGQSLAANGYVKLPGGLIIQWGSSAANGIVFPIEFPTACWLVTANVLSSGSGDSTLKSAMPWGIDRFGFQVTKRYVTDTGTYGFASEPIYWTAIGH